MGIFDTDDPEYALIYAEEASMVDASELISGALDRSAMTRADLARILNVSKSEVTARLAGERNITVRSLAKTLHVMGMHLELGATELKTDTTSVRGKIVRMEQFRALKRRREALNEQVPRQRMSESQLRQAMKVAR